jgi:hypothetical protein
VWKVAMLILAEGTVNYQLEGDARTAAQAWLGPMVDDGFVVDAYFNEPGGRVWMLLSSPDLQAARQRLNDLPVTRDGAVSFATTVVTKLRYR